MKKVEEKIMLSLIMFTFVPKSAKLEGFYTVFHFCIILYVNKILIFKIEYQQKNNKNFFSINMKNYKYFNSL